MDGQDRLLAWAVELQALAQAGLYYPGDKYDKERFTRIREIAAQMLSQHTGLELERVKELYLSDSGYQTPKLDCRAAMFRDDKVLLVQEGNGLWSLPGGWVDVGLSLGQAAVKEALEEAGAQARPLRLVALLDKDRHNPPIGPQKICKAFVLCRYLGGEHRANLETSAAAWWPLGALPPLDLGRTTKEQILLCHAASQAQNWETVFD